MGKVLSSLLLVGLIGVVVYRVVPREGIPTPGDPTRFAPLEQLEQVRMHVDGDPQLVSIKTRWVRSDGNVDLSTTFDKHVNRNHVEYTFSTAPTPQDPNRPVGTGKTQASHDSVTVKVEEPRWSSRMTVAYEGPVKHQGMSVQRVRSANLDKPKTAPVPTCNFADLWQRALAAGAPSDALAMIIYDHEGFVFRITEAQFPTLNRRATQPDDILFEMVTGSDCLDRHTDVVEPSAQDEATTNTASPPPSAHQTISIGKPEIQGPNASVTRTIRRHAREVEACHVHARAAGESAANKETHTMRFVIAPTGAVQSVSTLASASGSSSLTRCLSAAIKKWRFARSNDGGITVVNLPFITDGHR